LLIEKSHRSRLERRNGLKERIASTKRKRGGEGSHVGRGGKSRRRREDGSTSPSSREQRREGESLLRGPSRQFVEKFSDRRKKATRRGKKKKEARFGEPGIGLFLCSEEKPKGGGARQSCFPAWRTKKEKAFCGECSSLSTTRREHEGITKEERSRSSAGEKKEKNGAGQAPEKKKTPSSSPRKRAAKKGRAYGGGKKASAIKKDRKKVGRSRGGTQSHGRGRQL